MKKNDNCHHPLSLYIFQGWGGHSTRNNKRSKKVRIRGDNNNRPLPCPGIFRVKVVVYSYHFSSFFISANAFISFSVCLFVPTVILTHPLSRGSFVLFLTKIPLCFSFS